MQSIPIAARNGNSYSNSGAQLYVRDDFGNLRIVDLVVGTGGAGLMGIEVKYGSATRNARQLSVDNKIRSRGGRVVSVSNPILPYGSRVRFETVEIPVIPVQVPGP